MLGSGHKWPVVKGRKSSKISTILRYPVGDLDWFYQNVHDLVIKDDWVLDPEVAIEGLVHVASSWRPLGPSSGSYPPLREFSQLSVESRHFVLH